MCNRTWPGALMVVALLANAARADVSFTDNFNDEYLDPQTWTPSMPAFIAEVDGILKVTDNYGTGNAHVQTVYQFGGDFDVQFDFSLVEEYFPFHLTSKAGLRVASIYYPDLFHAEVYRERGSTEDLYVFHYRAGGAAHLVAEVPTSDMAGRLRLTRTNDNDFTAYYWAGGTWQSLGTIDNFTEPTTVDIYAAAIFNPIVTQIRADNFQMVADFVVNDCNANGIPDNFDLENCDGSAWCSDCNANGVLDACDISAGTSSDGNSNGVPDECESEPIPAVSLAGKLAIAAGIALAGITVWRRG